MRRAQTWRSEEENKRHLRRKGEKDKGWKGAQTKKWSAKQRSARKFREGVANAAPAIGSTLFAWKPRD